MTVRAATANDDHEWTINNGKEQGASNATEGQNHYSPLNCNVKQTGEQR